MSGFLIGLLIVITLAISFGIYLETIDWKKDKSELKNEYKN